MRDQFTPRTLPEAFGRTRDGSDRVPQPWPESKAKLAGAIYAVLLQAERAGDSMASLAMVHAASFLVAELHERMAPIRNWIPPLEEPLGFLEPRAAPEARG